MIKSNYKENKIRLRNEIKQLERVIVKPPDIVTFVGPLNMVRENFLCMHNETAGLLAFKVKESKNVSVTPHYGFLRPQVDLFIKLKAKKVTKLPDKEYITVILAYPPIMIPRNPKDFWHGSNEPMLTLQRKIRIVHEIPREATTKMVNDDDNAKNDSDDDENDGDPETKLPANEEKKIGDKEVKEKKAANDGEKVNILATEESKVKTVDEDDTNKNPVNKNDDG